MGFGVGLGAPRRLAASHGVPCPRHGRSIITITRQKLVSAPRSSSSSSGSSTSVQDVQGTVRHGQHNPLELLRETSDPQARARLFVELDKQMTHYSELYQPCPVEEFLSSELGVWSYNVMLFAVQHPTLQQYDLDTHVKPAVRSLKAAGLDHTDIWFVLTKRLELLSDPISLQRWLDFMAAQVGGV